MHSITSLFEHVNDFHLQRYKNHQKRQIDKNHQKERKDNVLHNVSEWERERGIGARDLVSEVQLML